MSDVSSTTETTEDAAEIGEGIRIQAFAELQQHAFTELENDWRDSANNA